MTKKPTPPPSGRPPIRVEIDRAALDRFDKRAILAQIGVGLAAGWLASWLVGGSGLVRYVVTGVAGSFVGGVLLEWLGVNLGIRNPLLAKIATATIGATVVVIAARIIA
jgi:uncharacterized membrane protein YeaQ/YmgE (transglycosylase-associated protein family)